MKNLIVEKSEVKMNEEKKVNSFIESAKSDDGVIIKIQKK